MNTQEELDSGGKLYKALSELKKQAISMHAVPQIRPSEFHLMHAIRRCCEAQNSALGAEAPPGIPVSTLSNYTHSSMPAVSQIVRALDEKQLAERISAKNDRRVVYIRLTEKGNAFLDQEEQNFLSFLNEIADQMGKEDTEQLVSLLNKLKIILEAVKKNHTNIS